MTREEARQLIGGYTAGNLTPEQESALLSLALEDQEIFDELMAEQPLKELFDDPVTRRDLLAALDEEEERKPASMPSLLPWWRKPLTWGLAGSLAGGVITAGLLIYRPGATPTNQAAVPPMIIASKTSHTEPQSPGGVATTPAPEALPKPVEPRRMMKKAAAPESPAVAGAPAPEEPRRKLATEPSANNSASDAAARPALPAMAAPPPPPPVPPSQAVEVSAAAPPVAPVPAPATPPREVVASTMLESSKQKQAPGARAVAGGMMFKAKASAPFEAVLERFDPSGSFVAATAPFDVPAAATPRLRVTGQTLLYFYIVQREGSGWEYLYESRAPESLVLTPVHTAASGPQRAVVVSSSTPLTHADVESAIGRSGSTVREVRFTLH